MKTEEVYEEEFLNSSDDESTKKKVDGLDSIIDIREYDVKYHIRTSIDKNLRVGLWYSIKLEKFKTVAELTLCPEIIKRPKIKVCAFDIETSKAPLMFPDSKIDQILMISYMIDKQGYLICNREHISEDIEDFVYNPKEDFGLDEFIVFNEKDEKSLLEKFFSHLREERPQIFVTYNGDFFDWPFVEDRAKTYQISMRKEIGVFKDPEGNYKSNYASHMDAYCWVKRDSYLPQGSHGLKAVTKAKLGYDPIEVNPEGIYFIKKRNCGHGKKRSRKISRIFSF
jgi:DNA polymerase epsilon subunit 1